MFDCEPAECEEDELLSILVELLPLSLSLSLTVTLRL